MEISLCMIVKNEEDTLNRCLRSVDGLADEIIIVDTGSNDRTKEIARGFTDKIYDFKWIDDFSAARNYSFSKATKDYIMWLDADDILTTESREALFTLKKQLDTAVDVVFMPYLYKFDEDGRVLQTLNRERIVKRASGFKWSGEIHETIEVSGNIIKSDIAVTHTKNHKGSDRNFLILSKIVNKGSKSSKILFYYASELFKRKCWDEAVAVFEDFFEQGGLETVYCLDAFRFLQILYIERRQYDKALQLASDCLPYCSDRSEFCCRLGFFYENIMDDIDEAVFWYERATKCLYPTEIDSVVLEEYYYYKPYYQLGELFRKQNLHDEALECYKEALEYKENDKELQDMISMYEGTG